MTATRAPAMRPSEPAFRVVASRIPGPTLAAEGWTR